MSISSSIKILQVNLNRNSIATESILQVAIELRIDLVLVQEPWVIKEPELDYSTVRSIIHPSFTQLLPLTKELRPRTLAYIAKGFRPEVTVIPVEDPDILILDILEKGQKIQILNVYNEKNQLGEGLKTLERAVFPREIGLSTIVLRDFNTHYPW